MPWTGTGQQFLYVATDVGQVRSLLQIIVGTFTASLL